MKFHLTALATLVLLFGSANYVFAQNQSATITSHRAQVNGLDMHYLRAGRGEPLVLLHGVPQHSLQWRKIMPTLAQQFTVIAPDLRGVGSTTITAAGYDKKTVAEDVRALVKQLGFEQQINLVGYDHGAGVAYSYAAMYPAQVRRLAILEYAMPGFGDYEASMTPNPKWDNDANWQLGFFTVPEVAERFMRGKEDEFLRWMFEHISCNPRAVSQADFDEYLRQLKKRGAMRAAINYYAAVWTDAANNKQFARTKLKMPVLAVGGECSGGAGIAAHVRKLAERVEGATIENAGHWLADENPVELAATLVRFFAAPPTGQTTAEQTPLALSVAAPEQPAQLENRAAKDEVMEVGMRAFKNWQTGWQTGDFTPFLAMTTDNFLFQFPAGANRGVFTGTAGKKRIIAKTRDHSAQGDRAIFTVFRTANSDKTVTFEFDSTGTIGGNPYKGRNAISFDVEKGKISGFREYFGDLGELQSPVNRTSVEAKIRRLDEARVRAWLKSDVTALDQLYADNYVIVNPNGSVRSKTEALEEFRTGRLAYEAIRVNNSDVRVHGDAAAVWVGHITSTARINGARSVGEWRVTNLYVRQGNVWQLASQHVTHTAE